MGLSVVSHTQSAKHDRMSPRFKVAPGHHAAENSPESILASVFRFGVDLERLITHQSRLLGHKRRREHQAYLKILPGTKSRIPSISGFMSVGQCFNINLRSGI